MPIVLAIEPDRRQAAHLTAIVGHQAGAELIVADTTESALDAIGDRVPDLVLVPALLSPQDDAALAAALRVIAAAAHVRTLSIPVLASGTRRAAAVGMLAKWRRRHAAAPEPDGCDPAVFGEQISTYLREAAAERAEFDEETLDVVRRAAGAVPSRPVAVVAPVEPLSPVEQAVSESIERWAADPVHPEVAESNEPVAMVAADESPQPLIDLSEELAALADDAGDDTFGGEPVGVYTIAVEAEAPTLEAFDLLQAILEPNTIARPDAALIADQPREDPREDLYVEPPEPPRADFEPWVPMSLTPGRLWPALEGMPAETPAPRTEQPDWIELVASLRQDLERRRIDAPAAAAPAIASRPSDGAESEARQRVTRQKPSARKSKPVQDEWGFFDPEQCGFSMLLAKLEEITEEAGIADC